MTSHSCNALLSPRTLPASTLSASYEAIVERKNKTHSFKKDSASSLISKRLMLIVESLLSHTLYYSALGEAAAAVAAASGCCCCCCCRHSRRCRCRCHRGSEAAEGFCAAPQNPHLEDTRLLPWTQESLGSSAGKQIFYLFCPNTVGKGMIMEKIAHQTCLKWIVLICLPLIRGSRFVTGKCPV